MAAILANFIMWISWLHDKLPYQKEILALIE